MRIAFLFLALVCSGLAAGEFDAVTFYGTEHFSRTAALEGKLTLKLDAAKPPHFVDFGNSDSGPAHERFEFTATGLVLKPASERESCEIELDVGAKQCSASFNVVELDMDAGIAFHLRGLAEDGPEFVIEVKRSISGAHLAIRTRTVNGFRELAGAELRGHDFSKTHALTLKITPENLSAKFADAKADARAKPGAFSLGVAANDRRARVSSLELELHFDDAWAEEAQARLQARLVLSRLNEYCTQGLLSGLSQSKLPTQDADLKQYTAKEQVARTTALTNSSFAERFSALDALAAAKPKIALAVFESGVSAMLAGYPMIARERLEAALAISDCALIRLVVAEACRRLREFENAQTHLAKAGAGIEDALRPDLELLQGRLAAARGDIAGARKLLAAAHDKWKTHEQLAVFAESADELAEPRLSAAAVTGPLGLTVLSDLDEKSIQKLLSRLSPFLERIRYWLPELGKKLDGTIAIYTSPTAYLRAAVLVAADSLDNVAGMFLPAGIGGGRSVIACRAFGEDELVRTLAHELWHLAVSTTAQSGMEPWLNEGMAVYISAGQLREGSLRFNALPTEFGAATSEVASALADSTAAQAAVEAGLARFYLPSSQRLNYAMAWALVWYHAENDMASERALRTLLSGDEKVRAALKKDLAQVMPRVAKALKDRKVQ